MLFLWTYQTVSAEWSSFCCALWSCAVIFIGEMHIVCRSVQFQLVCNLISAQRSRVIMMFEGIVCEINVRIHVWQDEKFFCALFWLYPLLTFVSLQTQTSHHFVPRDLRVQPEEAHGWIRLVSCERLVRPDIPSQPICLFLSGWQGRWKSESTKAMDCQGLDCELLF